MECASRNLREVFHLAFNEPSQEALAVTGVPIERAYEHFGRLLRARDTEMRRASATARKSHARGIRLLKENLSPAQRTQFEECGSFDVIGGKTGRRYRIKTGCQMNVYRLSKKGKPKCLLCFIPEGNLVVGDVMLAQKLALELFESETLKVANSFSPGDALFR